MAGPDQKQIFRGPGSVIISGVPRTTTSSIRSIENLLLLNKILTGPPTTSGSQGVACEQAGLVGGIHWVPHEALCGRMSLISHLRAGAAELC